ncbi:MAG TPA: PDZ domain-containing protein, partial [Actinomycetota bacterium]|nr:PDZ domain-containing protein [Actinomycetota bacterium]
GVFPDGPADMGGVEPGDVIVDVGGREVGSTNDLTEALTRFDPKEQIEVVVIRAGDEVTIEVELGQRPTTIQPAPDD